MSADHRDVLVDAHVHYHSGFSRDAFFAAASSNTEAGARQLGLPGAITKVLLMTESAGTDMFGGFAAEAARASAGGSSAAADSSTDTAHTPAGTSGTLAATAKTTARTDWSFRQTREGRSLWATSADDSILVIAGRQIVTRDRLEVLALGCRAGIADGLPLRAARDAVIEAGGVPVVPWGFGKWWFARGRRVAQLLGEEAPGRWFLGDNAGRPHLSRRPTLFGEAARHGVFVLPGSDPLPLPGQEAKAGRCGFVMPQALDKQRPAAALLDWLRNCSEQPTTFGRYEDLGRFARDQLAMQLRSRGKDAIADTAGAPSAEQPSEGQPSSPAARGDSP